MTEEKSPAEIGRETAKRTLRDLEMSKAPIQMSAAIFVCLQQLVALLIEKKVLGSQEVLDAFEKASGEIQSVPDGALGVQIVEGLCSFVAKLPGATRVSN